MPSAIAWTAYLRMKIQDVSRPCLGLNLVYRKGVKRLDKEHILLSGSPVEIAEYGDYKMATFLISVLDEYDLNDRMIPKEAGELYHSTMVGFPILAKMVCDAAGDPVDFAGHEMYAVQNENGDIQVRFNTQPIGSVVETWIEDRHVPGYSGEKSCIMIKAKLWSSRYPEYFAVLDKLWAAHNVKSSWELTLHEVVQTARGRILKAFSFIGNTLLGSNVEGAVPGAGVYEYAQLDPEVELASALSKDLCRMNASQRKEENTLENETKQVVEQPAEPVTAPSEADPVAEETSPSAVAESVVADEQVVTEEQSATPEYPADDQDIAGQVPEQAMLTEYDLRRRVNEAYRAQYDKWGWVCFWFPANNEAWMETEGRESELDYDRVIYTVENDQVSITSAEPVKLTVSVSEINQVMEARDSAIEKANSKINDLTAQVAALQPYKDAADKAEQERIEAETAQKRQAFKEKMLASKLFDAEEIETSETLSAMVDTMDETALKLEIADRFIRKMGEEEKATETEVASAKEQIAASVQTRVVVQDSEKIDNGAFMRALLRQD